MRKLVRIGDFVTITNGFAFKSSNYKSQGVRVIRISNVQKGRIEDFDPKYYPFETFNDLKNFQIYENDILISLTGNVGRVGIFPKELLPAFINQRVCRIKPKNDELFFKYLFYILNSDQFEFDAVNNSSGIAQLNLSTKWIEDYKIPLPPLETQKKIAAILDKADELRQNDKKILEKYDRLAQSVFLEMFGDPVSNPKNWEIHKFSEVGMLERGISKHRPRNAPILLNGPYPLVQTGDVANSGGYIKSFKSTYSEVGLRQSKLWKKGTLCITIAANIAKTGILTFDACFPDSIVGFVPNNTTNNVYVQYWLSFLQKNLEDTAPESAQKNINLAILRDLDIPVPPISKQNVFKSIIENITNHKAITLKSLQKSEDLFQSLLQRAFKGELV